MLTSSFENGGEVTCSTIEKNTKKVKLIEMTSSNDVFFQEFTGGLTNLLEHSRRVQIQYAEIHRPRTVMKSLQECTIQLDYVANCACCYTSEVNSVYYDTQHVSIDPMIIHYRDGDIALQHQSIGGITEDTGHTMVTVIQPQPSFQNSLTSIM